jgi:hypothetical protein
MALKLFRLFHCNICYVNLFFVFMNTFLPQHFSAVVEDLSLCNHSLARQATFFFSFMGLLNSYIRLRNANGASAGYAVGMSHQLALVMTGSTSPWHIPYCICEETRVVVPCTPP